MEPTTTLEKLLRYEWRDVEEIEHVLGNMAAGMVVDGNLKGWAALQCAMRILSDTKAVLYQAQAEPPSAAAEEAAPPKKERKPRKPRAPKDPPAPPAGETPASVADLPGVNP